MVLLALALLLSVPARAQDCPALFESALRSGQTTQPLLSCFAEGSGWLDGYGRRTGRRAVEQGLKSLLAVEPSLEGPELVRWRSARTAFLAGFASAAPSPRHFVFAVDPSSAGWRNPRLFSAARPWPRPSREVTAAGAEAQAGQAVLDAFNGLFGKGDIDGWMARWRPDAVFVTNGGPVAGAAQLGDFFRRRRALYREVRMVVSHGHGSPAAGASLWEADLRGRCLRGGTPFDVHALVWIELKEGRISRIQEAFSSQRNHCDAPEPKAADGVTPR